MKQIQEKSDISELNCLHCELGATVTCLDIKQSVPMTRIALWVRFAKYTTKQESIAGLCDRPTAVSPFHERARSFPRSTDAALCG